MKLTIEEVKQKVEKLTSDPDYYKNLRRGIARDYHPDHATDAKDRANREEIMKLVNDLCDKKTKGK